jgi:hypothetical protein
MEMMIKCLYLSLILFLIVWAVQAEEITTGNLLPNGTNNSSNYQSVDSTIPNITTNGFTVEGNIRDWGQELETTGTGSISYTDSLLNIVTNDDTTNQQKLDNGITLNSTTIVQNCEWQGSQYQWETTFEPEFVEEFIPLPVLIEEFPMLVLEEEELVEVLQTTQELEEEFEEVEILQVFGGPEIVEEETEVTEEAPTETIAATEEIMEEQPEQSESSTVATVQEEPESEPSSNEQVAVDLQDVQTQVAVKIKAIDKQLAATNIIGAQLIEAQQVDLSSYNKSYTDNRKIYEGNTYEDLRTLDEYSKKIYNDNTKFVAISMNDPVRKYQEKLRDATIKRQMAERELRQLRGY